MEIDFNNITDVENKLHALDKELYDLQTKGGGITPDDPNKDYSRIDQHISKTYYDSVIHNLKIEHTQLLYLVLREYLCAKWRLDDSENTIERMSDELIKIKEFCKDTFDLVEDDD